MTDTDRWIVPGLRTPFTKVDGPLSHLDSIGMSVPVVRAMWHQQLAQGAEPDLAVWGTVAPNLGWANLAREVLLDAGVGAHVPAFSTIMQCSTSAAAALQAASMLGSGDRELALCGGVESMSRVQIGISQGLSDWLRRLTQARTLGDRIRVLTDLDPRAIRLHIPSVANRVTGKSMGQHAEETTQQWSIARADQDALAYDSHRKAVAAQDAGFFDDLIVAVGDADTDAFPRRDTSTDKLARLRPVFDRSDAGSITAGNASPLTDGAAGVWVATDEGLGRLPADAPRARLVDFELAAVDIHAEGLLMAPAYALPRLLARQELSYDDIGLFEIHEAFAAQVLFTLAAWEDTGFLTDKVGLDADVATGLGSLDRSRINPHGGSVSLGHPFGATGARILSQATKELWAMPSGTYGVVSICADGGVGSVVLLQRP